MEKKILIIDDSEQDRMIMKRFLTKAGYDKIETAQSGEEGLEKMASARPDLVILDTMLPGINGFEVCRKISEAGKGSAPKVIMMTGTVDAVDAVKARKAGADDYCVKTSDCSSMLEAVKKFI